MAFRFSKRSLSKLRAVHPDLQKIMHLALAKSPIDFGITEGRRTLARQKKLLAAGATRTLASKHLKGHAVDVAAYVNGKVRWDWPLYERIANAVKDASRELGIAVRWGGDWTTFKDGPHFELINAEE